MSFDPHKNVNSSESASSDVLDKPDNNPKGDKNPADSRDKLWRSYTGTHLPDDGDGDGDEVSVGYAHRLAEGEEHGFKSFIRHKAIHLLLLARWIVIGVLVGLIVGAFATLFAWLVMTVTAFRTGHWQIMFFLPFAGLLIVFLYKITGNEKDGGTNIVLYGVQTSDVRVPALQAPLIFIGTVITHLFGGSAGREGAALQIGGSLGGLVGKLFEKILHLDESEKRSIILCGMSAAFSAIFGTPMAAVVFPLEVVSVGVMHYSALVPCAVASLTASHFAVNMGIRPEEFPKFVPPELTIPNAALIVALAILAAWVSILFCVMLNRVGRIFEKYLENRYLRVFVGGLIIVALTLLLGTRDYLGAGTQVIERAIEGQAHPAAFLLKMLFTAVTIEAGFKGGEIVPSFFIGATFGCLFGTLTGFDPALCAAIGMACVFCGVTNCPISTLLISFELFGFAGIPYYLLAIPVCFMMSEYYGLYKEQRIMFSKFRLHYVNRKTQA